MTLQQKNKKVFIYIFLFLIFATFNKKDSYNTNFGQIDKILIKGLDDKNNFELIKNLNFLKKKNIFFLKKNEIKEIIETNNYVENYSVFRIYPSSIDIKIEETIFLAHVKKGENNFFLGSNGKFIKSTETNQNLPNIFGDFKVKNFFDLKNAMRETNFNFSEIKNLFFFKSGRWDIETNYGLLIKLPKEGLKESLKTLISFININDLKEIGEIDLRQKNQIITNE